MTTSASKDWISAECTPGLVSVIIPTYNREKYLGEAIQSVVDQTYPNWECIVVDDGSTDGTRQLVQTFIDKHGPEKVRYFYQPNSGAPTARNFGLAQSLGEYVQFLDSDDWFSRDCLDSRIRSLAATACQILYGPCMIVVDADGLRREYMSPESKPPPVKDYLSCQLRGWSPFTTTCLYKREVFIDIGPWDVELAKWQDKDLAFRLGIAGYSPDFVPCGTYHVRCHKGGRLADGFGPRHLGSHRRVFEKVLSLLIKTGKFEKYRADAACFCLLSALGYTNTNVEETLWWLARAEELGPASVTVAQGPYALVWRWLGPERAVRARIWLNRLFQKLRPRRY